MTPKLCGAGGCHVRSLRVKSSTWYQRIVCRVHRGGSKIYVLDDSFVFCFDSFELLYESLDVIH